MHNHASLASSCRKCWAHGGPSQQDVSGCHSQSSAVWLASSRSAVPRLLHVQVPVATTFSGVPWWLRTLHHAAAVLLALPAAAKYTVHASAWSRYGRTSSQQVTPMTPPSACMSPGRTLVIGAVPSTPNRLAGCGSRPVLD